MSNFWPDIRFAFRVLLHNRGFAAIAILTLALGIGANTALFSVVNGVLLNPLPFPNPDDLYALYTKTATFELPARSAKAARACGSFPEYARPMSTHEAGRTTGQNSWPRKSVG